MHSSPHPSSPSPTRSRGIDRRSILRLGAWSVPAMLLASAAPTAAVAAPLRGPARASAIAPFGQAWGPAGPDGTHWPLNTPRPTDAFDRVYRVAANWDAIGAAMNQAARLPVTSTVKIEVAPGVLGNGWGAGSSAGGPMVEVPAGRTSNILIVPAQGWGSVTAAGDARTSNGYSIVGLRKTTFAGFDFSNKIVLLRNCQDVAFAWSTFSSLNITANTAGAAGSIREVRNIEFVECVIPDALNFSSSDTEDRMAFRVGDNRPISGVRMVGCYVAPSYKEAGSSAHADSLQTSGSGTISGLVFEDSVFFQSSSQILQFANTSGVTLAHSLFVGGLRGTGRYPLAPDRHVMVGQNTLWGSATNVVATDTLVLGSASSSWRFTAVEDTLIANRTSPAGAFTLDTTSYGTQSTVLPDDVLDALAPYPTAGRMQAVWSSLAVA